MICTLIVITIFSLLISLQIDYYKQLPFEIKEDNVYVVLEHKPQSVFLNVNNHVYEISKMSHVKDKVYLLDFTVHKEMNDKVFCYSATYKLNYLAYIFKVVFNI